MSLYSNKSRLSYILVPFILSVVSIYQSFAYSFSNPTFINRSYRTLLNGSSGSDVTYKEAQNSEDENWQSIAKDAFSGKDRRPIILFDGVCNLCSSAVNFALDYDDVGKFVCLSYPK